MNAVRPDDSTATALVNRRLPVAWYRLLYVAVLAGGFALDWQTPLGQNVPALYLVAIVIAGLAGPRDLWIVTGAATLLTGLGLFVGRPGGSWTAGVFNRAVDGAGFWVVFLLLRRLTTASAALQRSVRMLSDFKWALDQASIVATTDRRGLITYVNDKFCEISMYSRDELIGQDHRIVNSAYHSKAFMKELWRTIGTGKVWHGEIRNRAKDGSFYWVDTTIVPFVDARNRPYQYLAIRTDVTSRKLAEEQLQAQESLTRLGELAAVVAHEVKNPLAGILGSLHILGTRFDVDSRERAVVDQMVTRLHALNEMVEDLLRFAQSRPPVLGPVRIKELLLDTAQLLHSDGRHAGIQIVVDSDDLTILADQQQLKQVLLNLFINAAQATGDHGTVRARAQASDGMCRLVISDSGPGILPEVRTRIFDPFFTTKTRGTGLGLTIVKRLVELHGGAVQVECPTEGGTTVVVTLPARPAIAGQQMSAVR
jgi:PAS domain S-box-containing protein